MAERWYDGWDSGIHSDVASAAATKPPSRSGLEFTRLHSSQSISYQQQQNYYAQQQSLAAASSHEMEYTQVPQPLQQHQQEHQPQPQLQQLPIKEESTLVAPPKPVPQIIEPPCTPPAKRLSCMTPQQHQTPSTTGGFHANDEDTTTAQAIPKLTQLLRDEDPVVVSHATVLVNQLSKGERGKHVVLASRPLIEALLETLSTNKDPEIIRTITATLSALSQVRHGLQMICHCGGIPAVICVLSFPSDHIDQATLHYALTMLHSALLQEADIGRNVKQEARASQGAAALTRLLSRDNPKFLAILTDCLHILCHGHSESKLGVVANGGPQLLVRIMRTYAYEKLLWIVSRLMKVLSTCQQNKLAIIEAGGMHALTAQLSQPSSRLVMNCLYSLRNLSDAATKQTGLDHLMHFLLSVLKSVRDKDMLLLALGILANLTCNNQHNKIVICNSSGIEIVSSVLGGCEQYPEVMEPCLCTLRHLTSRHPTSDHAQAIFRDLGGIQYIAKLLSTPWSAIRPPIVKAACGLLRNFALVEANHPLLLESGCIPKLVDILLPASNELLSAANAGVSAPKSNDGTKLDDLAEQAAGAIHALLRDPACRQVAKQTGVGQALFQLASCPLVAEATRKQANAALTELASIDLSTPSTVPQQQQQQASDRLPQAPVAPSPRQQQQQQQQQQKQNQPPQPQQQYPNTQGHSQPQSQPQYGASPQPASHKHASSAHTAAYQQPPAKQPYHPVHHHQMPVTPQQHHHHQQQQQQQQRLSKAMAGEQLAQYPYDVPRVMSIDRSSVPLQQQTQQSPIAAAPQYYQPPPMPAPHHHHHQQQQQSWQQQQHQQYHMQSPHHHPQYSNQYAA